MLAPSFIVAHRWERREVEYTSVTVVFKSLSSERDEQVNGESLQTALRDRTKKPAWEDASLAGRLNVEVEKGLMFLATGTRLPYQRSFCWLGRRVAANCRYRFGVSYRRRASL